MDDRKRFLLLFFIMTAVCLIITTVSIWILYLTSIEEERDRLTETAQSQARLIESIARFDTIYSTDYPEGARAATLRQVQDAHNSYKGFGETGEFTLGHRKGNLIIFVLNHRHFDLNRPKPVPLDSGFAVPMRLALSGKSGTVIARDYRGVQVLAAHEPVDVLNLGIVAKIDMAEIRAPFIRSIIIVLCLMGVLVSLGAAFFLRISHPIIRRLEVQNKALQREIMERKRSEEALRDNEDFLRLLIDTIPIPVFYKDKSGKYLGCNRAFEDLFGQDAKQIAGKTVFDISPLELAEIYDKMDHELFQKGGLQHYGCQVKNAQGEMRDVYFYKAALTNKENDVIGLIGTINDVTEIKKAEAAIKSREQLLNEMGSIARIGGWEHDLISREATWTREVFKIMKISESDPVPGPDKHLDFYLPEDKVRLEKAYEDVVKNGGQFDLELQCANAEGRRFWARAIGRPEFENGKCIRMKGTFQDITDRKLVEERLQQAQRMESIGHLAGGIAHDFNNLLFPIVGMAELLLEDLPPGSPEYENAQVIYESGKRGGDLVKQILAFSRQSEHKLTPVRAQQILREVLRLIRATIPSYIEVEEDIQSDCGLLIADPTQIHQVAMNIMTNAFHAVESTGGKITVRLKEVCLEKDDVAYGLIGEGRYALISISDTGPGMPQELLNRIFEPYFTTKELGKGTGLGLAVAYGLIKEHKGDIKVYSEPGKGSTFNIYLPLMEKRDFTDSLTHAEEPPTGDERVLLIDDEVSIVKLEKQMLERLGYTVTFRTSSLDALEAFKAMPYAFDIIVSDMTMPNMTGDQLAREIQAIRPDMPIVICSGFSERMDEKKAAARGIKAFLMKPVIKAELANAVRDALDGAQSH